MGIEEDVCCEDSAFIKRVYVYDSIKQIYSFEEYDLVKLFHNITLKGQVKQIDPEIKHGLFEYFDMYGNRLIERYINNEFIGYENAYDENSLPIEPIFQPWQVDVELKTMYTAVMNDFSKELLVNNKTNIKDRIIVSFIVEKNGQTSKVIVNRGISEDIDKQLINFIRKRTFNPIYFNNALIRCRFTLPISIEIE